MILTFLPLLFALMWSGPPGPLPEVHSTQEACARMEKKIALLEERSTLPEGKRGGPVTMTQEEIESFFALSKIPKIPEGVSDIHFDLHPNKQGAHATVDFDRYKATSKRPVNPLVDLFLRGKKSLATEGVATFPGNGTGVYHLEWASLDTFTAKASTIEFLLKWFVLPRYPKAQMDQTFVLPSNIRKVEVREGEIVVYP